ncbi:MAG: hypothetical protein JW959_15100 [Pirellulales bacterium]|nr:hypothetical protein [Pirellulales bacterium]
MLPAILNSPSGTWYVGKIGLLLFGAVLTVGVFSAEVRTAVAAADTTGEKAADEVRYSTGRNGSRLKWLPYRPKSREAESRAAPRGEAKVVAVQYMEPIAAPQADEQPGRTPDDRLFNDPFGDREGKRTDNSAGQEAPRAMPEEPRPASPLPGPETVEKPYVPHGAFPAINRHPNGEAMKKPLLEESFGQQQFKLDEKCPSAEDLKDIGELGTDIAPSEGDLPKDCRLGDIPFKPRSFAPITYTWTASGLCHKPLYFEDVQLERYGHMAGPWLQPFASGAHFFATIPILPYKMGIELPNECMYTLGYHRPGNCAPYMLDPIPLSVRGALFEAGAWVAGVYMIP